MNHVYGVVIDGVHHDVSKTKRGAKNYATRNGYTVVSARWDCGYNASIISTKINGKWSK